MWKEDYIHFLRDRLKIAKNLKKILKRTFRKSFVPTEARKVNVYRLHVYRNTIYLYSMSMSMLNMYCCVELMKFDIPITPMTFAKELPLYIKKMIQVFDIVKNSYDVAEDYMTHYDYTSDDSSSPYLSPAYISPQKKKYLI